TLKFRHTLFSDIAKSPFGLNFGFYTATALKNHEGKVEAILTSFLSQSWLQEEIAELESLLKSKELPHMNITLFNTKGIVLASNFNREIGAPFIKSDHFQNLVKGKDESLLEALNKIETDGHKWLIATSADSHGFLKDVKDIKTQLSLISL